jgi:hypothetical protein
MMSPTAETKRHEGRKGGQFAIELRDLDEAISARFDVEHPDLDEATSARYRDAVGSQH